MSKQTKMKFEKEFTTSSETKIKVANLRKSIDDNAKSETKCLCDILAKDLKFDEFYPDAKKATPKKIEQSIKYIKNKANKKASIQIKLRSIVNENESPALFEIKIVYKDGVGPCIEVTTEGHTETFRFEMLERNFMNRIMLFYNKSTGKCKFNVDSKKYDYLKYKA